MPSTDPGHAAALTRNARAAERERLRNLAIRNLADAGLTDPTDDQVEELADQLERNKLAAAGRRGGALRRTRRAQLNRFEAAHATIQQHLGFLAQLVDAIAPVDPDTCEHEWPGDLGEDAACERCCLPYEAWSEPEQVAA